MTLRNRVQDIERRASAADRDPAEMTLAELCTEIIRTLEGDSKRLQSVLQHLPDDLLNRHIEALKHAAAAGSLEVLNGPELLAVLQACTEGVEA